jgi:ribosomal protein L40E
MQCVAFHLWVCGPCNALPYNPMEAQKGRKEQGRTWDLRLLEETGEMLN